MKYKVWVATYKDLPEGEGFERINPETKKVEYCFDYLYSQDFEVEKIERTEHIPKDWQGIFRAMGQAQEKSPEKGLPRKLYNVYIRTEEDMTNEDMEWEIRGWLREEGHEGVLIKVSKVGKKVKVRKCRKCGGKLKPIKHKKYPNASQCQKCGEIYVSLSFDPSKLSPKIIEGLRQAKQAGEKLPFDLELDEG